MLYQKTQRDNNATAAAGREIRAKFYANYPGGSILYESVTLGGYRILGQITEKGFIYFYGTDTWYADVKTFDEVRDDYKDWYRHALLVAG